MSKKPNQMIVQRGRPSPYSDDVLNEIMKQLQLGHTLAEISEMPGMPTFRTLANWRQTKPEFFQILVAVEEDMTRQSRRDMRNVSDVLKQGVATLSPKGAVEFYGAVKAAVDSIDKIAKVQIVKGDAPPPNDSSEEAQTQRKAFDQLHPYTQEKIRLALQEDQRLREGSDEEE